MSQTDFEHEKAELLQPGYVRPEKRPKEAQQLVDIVTKFKTENHFEPSVFIISYRVKVNNSLTVKLILHLSSHTNVKTVFKTC